MHTLSLTVNGIDPDEPGVWTESVFDIQRGELIKSLPQMIKSMTDPLVPQIEDPDHFLNGWQLETIIIEKTDDDDDE